MEVSSKKQKIADDVSSSGAEGDEPAVASQSFNSSVNTVTVTVSLMGVDEFRDFTKSSLGTPSIPPNVTPPIGNVASSTGTPSDAPSVSPPVGNVASPSSMPSKEPSVTPPVGNVASKSMDMFQPDLLEYVIQSFLDSGDQVADDSACVGHKVNESPCPSGS
ncbi:hypothetical protein BHE74_00009889 [Ensete ventricosum]|nr:hypothetical protein BHE74_00009889 [Ensete ventricosum]RZS04122.1 hypothetical protein BHM03_00034414 [Ensete ventricosum]